MLQMKLVSHETLIIDVYSTMNMYKMCRIRRFEQIIKYHLDLYKPAHESAVGGWATGEWRMDHCCG